MKIPAAISAYLKSLPEPKRKDMEQLHSLALQLFPDAKLWFLDGKNDQGKVVSNPNIGYGSQTLNYADGTSKEFYKVGISANSTGISIYIMTLDDKTYLTKHYAKKLGKATVTGYCIKCKKLDDLDVPTLKLALKDGFSRK